MAMSLREQRYASPLACLVPSLTCVTGKPCPFGEDYCCMAHRCPHGPKCLYAKQNKCKFAPSAYNILLQSRPMSDSPHLNVVRQVCTAMSCRSSSRPTVAAVHHPMKRASARPSRHLHTHYFLYLPPQARARRAKAPRLLVLVQTLLPNILLRATPQALCNINGVISD